MQRTSCLSNSQVRRNLPNMGHIQFLTLVFLAALLSVTLGTVQDGKTDDQASKHSDQPAPSKSSGSSSSSSSAASLAPSGRQASAQLSPTARQSPTQQYALSYPLYYSNPYNSAYYSALKPPSRRSSFTSKLRNLMNAIFFRRDSTKPYYQPSEFAYDPQVASKPYYLSQNGYKPIQIPLRQLQKYYKTNPYGSTNAAGYYPYANAAQSLYGTGYGLNGLAAAYGNGLGSTYGTANLPSSNYGNAAAAATAALTGSTYGTSGTAGSLGAGSSYSSSYAYPVQSSYNIGRYSTAASSYNPAGYQRSSQSPNSSYSSSRPVQKVSYPKSR